MGNPSKYTRTLGDRICQRLAEGESLRSICSDDGMPNKATVLRWLLNKSAVYDWFREQYDYAREIQTHLIEDEMLDIADDGSNDFIERIIKGKKTLVFDKEHVQRSRLRVDARDRKLARMASKRLKDDGTGGDKAKPQTINLVLIPKLEKPIE